MPTNRVQALNPLNAPAPHSPQHQRGLSLVELMVALAVSLLLLAGVFQIYLGNRQSYTTQQGISFVQEGGRFSTLFLARSIRHSGYLTNVYADPSDVYSDAEPPVSGVENGAAPDVITVRYQGYENLNNQPVPNEERMLDCFGADVPANTTVANEFSLSDPDANGLRNLRCQTFVGPTAAGDPVSTARLSLVQGVQDLQITYGFDESANKLRDINSYVTADDITDWRNVRSVRLNLTVADADIGTKQFTTTVSIRNRFDDFDE